MRPKNAVYQLDPILDDPRYEGFGVDDNEIPDLFPEIRTRDWKVIPQAKTWVPLKAKGRVREFNDYPCVNLAYPAFSARAVDSLRDFLEDNGELLPLITSVGTYFFYNITTVADVLDLERSQVRWFRNCEGIHAMAIRVHEFIADKMEGLSIFRVPIKAMSVYVTEAFAARAREHKLRGMNFIKLWPKVGDEDQVKDLPQRRQRVDRAPTSATQSVKGNSVVIRLALSDARSHGTRVEKKAVDRLMDQLDAILVDVTSDRVPVGNLEGNDFGEAGECRLFLSCPNADQLVKTLRPWLKKLDWPHPVAVVKRYGNFADPEAREEPVKL